jgi:hypothetical protein
MAANGILSGTPTNEDIGSGSDSTILQITVLGTDQDTVNIGNTFSEYAAHGANAGSHANKSF